jgi:hypothetical protein
MSVLHYPLLPTFANAPPQVQVAPDGQLVYSPSNLAAKNGTTVTFYFPKYKSYHWCLPAMLIHALCSGSTLHSVTQGFFERPCVYLAASGGNPAGFDSGLQSGKEFTLEITDDKERR